MPKTRDRAARKASANRGDAVPTGNVEAMAVLARKKRTQDCEREVMLAIRPILARHRCRLGTIQEIVDGQPGPTRIVVIAND